MGLATSASRKNEDNDEIIVVQGPRQAFIEGIPAGFSDGYKRGLAEGYAKGYDAGFKEGYDEAKAMTEIYGEP